MGGRGASAAGKYGGSNNQNAQNVIATSNATQLKQQAKQQTQSQKKAYDTSMPANAVRSVLSAEGLIANNPTETAIIFDINGNKLESVSQNNSSQVNFTADQLKKMAGGIATHNHPNDGPFSDDDLKLAYYNDINTIRAVGKTTYYELSKISGKSQKPGLWTGMNTADAQYRKNVGDKIFNKLNSDYNSGKISYSEYIKGVKDLNNKCWQVQSDWLANNADSYGYIYKTGKR